MTRANKNMKGAKVPRVIMHNSVSLDGSFTDFEVNMGLHYQIAGEYRTDTTLVGSDTVKTGMELYGGEVPPENESDFVKPDKDANLPYWVIPDTKGKLKGMLHVLRRFEFCRDVVVLVSGITPEEYIKYLKERHYDYLVCGDERVDYKAAFKALNTRYGTEAILTDAGPTLNGILLENGLVDEISLLIHPYLVGSKSDKLLAQLAPGDANIELKLLGCRGLDNSYALMHYQVLKSID